MILQYIKQNAIKYIGIVPSLNKKRPGLHNKQ